MEPCNDDETPRDKREYIVDLECRLESYGQMLKDNKNEMNILEDKLRRKNEILIEMESNTVHIDALTQLECDLDQKNMIIEELNKKLESFLKSDDNKDDIQDINDLLCVINVKDVRIRELEEAVRESLKICTERENVLHQEENRRKRILEKVHKLEQRLLSLQAAQAVKCHSCRPIVLRMHSLESKLSKLVSERKDNLQELAHMKREALEAAISEKDAHLALLEMSGIRNAKQSDEVDRLKLDRRRLVDRLKQENELSVSLIEDSSSFENLDEIDNDNNSVNGKLET